MHITLRLPFSSFLTLSIFSYSFRNVIFCWICGAQRNSCSRRRRDCGFGKSCWWNPVVGIQYARILLQLGIEQSYHWPHIKSVQYKSDIRRLVRRRGKRFGEFWIRLSHSNVWFHFDLQGALIGSGASLFGIGSDIAGSIRIPALYNGIFGHKPTGGLLSINNHFPTSSDENFAEYLVVGPMCRYAKDLPTLLHIMAGKNAERLRLHEPLFTKDIKVNSQTYFY